MIVAGAAVVKETVAVVVMVELVIELLPIVDLCEYYSDDYDD